MQNIITYRDRTEETIQRATMPATPAGFLSVRLDGTRTNAQRFGGRTKGKGHDDRLVDECDEIVSTTTANTDEITDVLSRPVKILALRSQPACASISRSG
ncbi:hypothetical protein [Haladaptatus salinisoli]|uniref:hypothetical protein n=1 Tax=Haladaptatus salinisoli TaxID=2884876 RepID=UPI001D09C407|nr:hypothetical protein [Haladaptatus salinisoli]